MPIATIEQGAEEDLLVEPLAIDPNTFMYIMLAAFACGVIAGVLAGHTT